MTDPFYSRLRERARSNPESQFVRLPVVPSLGMMIAAADTTGVFVEGDRLWEWFESYEEEHDAAGLKVHPDLVTRFGMQKAFALACLADLWGIAVEGVEFWLRDRSRNPRSSGDDMIHYAPDRCPPGGWPPDRAACTDAHRSHARMTSEPFKTYWTSWQALDGDFETVAPRSLPSSAAFGLAHAYLSVDSYMQTQDVVALGRVPYVPSWTRESSFDEEERHELFLAAMWRGAVSWLLSEECVDASAFPYHPDAQAVIVSNMVFRHHAIWRKAPDYIMGAPYDRFTIMTDRALLTIAVADGVTSYWYREKEGRRMMRNEGLVARCGRDSTGLSALLSRVSSHEIVSFEAIPLAADWGEGQSG